LASQELIEEETLSPKKSMNGEFESLKMELQQAKGHNQQLAK
jgi:hypothetical protein